MDDVPIDEFDFSFVHPVPTPNVLVNKHMARSADLKIFDFQTQLESFSKRLDEMRQIAEFERIKSKRIIGITSYGATRFQALVQLLQSPIGVSYLVKKNCHSDDRNNFSIITVIVEGANNILEAHTIATLTTSLEHLILIGSLQQLFQFIDGSDSNPHCSLRC